MKINSAPHCDIRVLHAPGQCQHCDRYPLWQQLRIEWGISFSGQEPTQQQPISCPADLITMFKQIDEYRKDG